MIQEERFLKHSFMHKAEREFVLQAIKTHKPKKILTVGVAAGANEALILKLLENEKRLDEVELHCIDYCENYWMPEFMDKKIGFLVDEFVPKLKQNYHLYTPGLSINHLDKIGKDIDFCIIDTVHKAPGEALDFLMILPYLAKNAVLIMHDLIINIADSNLYDKYDNICALTFLSWNGKKEFPKPYLQENSLIALTPYYSHKALFQNIGLCILADNQLDKDNIESYFRVLAFPWKYMPSDEDLELCKEHFLRHYGKEFVDYFEELIKIQAQWLGQVLDAQEHVKHLQDELNSALRLKEHLSYKLGQALIKAKNNAWGGGGLSNCPLNLCVS